MKIKLPKRLRGFAYNRVLPVELNDFEVDILLPSVFFKVISQGQDRGRKANDPANIRGYVTKLTEHPDVVGFEGPEGIRLCDRLVRTSLTQIGRRGLGRATGSQQIQGLTGYTLLSFKTGFPEVASSLRQVDDLIYRMMREQLREYQPLRKFFERIFGKGVDIQGGPEPDGHYDGKTELDTLTRLSIAFLDGFATTGVRPSKSKGKVSKDACPEIYKRMARDLRRYLAAYHQRMPIEALSYYLKALINAELFFYTLKLFYAMPELVEKPQMLPAAMRKPLEGSPPEVYLDFTGSATGLNREMAGYCVRRDLETIQRFVAATLTLRQLDRYVHQIRGDRRVEQTVTSALGTEEGGPEYLQALLQLLADEQVSVRVEAAAQRDEEEIRKENAATDQAEDEVEQGSEEIDRIADIGETDFERLILLLVEGQRTKIVQSIAKWYWNVGGLTKPYGVLSGTVGNRQSWRYGPSNDFLAVLVQLAAVDIPKGNHEETAPSPVGLGEFLKWLEKRFGVIVDRPPEEMVGADYAAAAKENLRAMLRRLRQMGVFRDLSDDFAVQRLIPPYSANGEAD